MSVKPPDEFVGDVPAVELSSYRQRYRPAARRAQPIDSSASHLGFRCVLKPGPI